MDIALDEARKALSRGEVPVGCALLDFQFNIVAVGSNRANEFGDATRHAELVAFEALGIQRYPPRSLTLYVTCEPCVMCAAAIVQMEVVKRIVYGCANPRFGGCGSVRGLEMYGKEVPEVEGDVEAEVAVELLGKFYMRSNPNAPRPKKRRIKK